MTSERWRQLKSSGALSENLGPLSLREVADKHFEGGEVTWVVMSDLSVEQQTCIFMPGHK